MSRPVDHVATVAHMRSLYGIERQQREPIQARSSIALCRDLHGAAQALEATARSWTGILPRPAAVEQMRHTLAGMQQLLAELAAVQAKEAQHDPAA